MLHNSGRIIGVGFRGYLPEVRFPGSTTQASGEKQFVLGIKGSSMGILHPYLVRSAKDRKGNSVDLGRFRVFRVFRGHLRFRVSCLSAAKFRFFEKRFC